MSLKLYTKTIALFVLLSIHLNCSNAGEPEENNDYKPLTQVQINALQDLAVQLEREAPYNENGPLPTGEAGDAMLFNALLYPAFVGDSFFFDSIAPSGQPFRAPSEYYRGQNSFSRDMFLGLILYTSKSGNTDLLYKVLDYVRENDYTLCPDAVDNRCTLTPWRYPVPWWLASLVVQYYGGTPLEEANEGAAEYVYLGQAFNPLATGYPVHLSAVSLEILRTVGKKLNNVSSSLVKRQPHNPYFIWLHYGAVQKAAREVLVKCEVRSIKHQVSQNGVLQWAWQRDEEEQAWLQSAGWDCVFIINKLLGE